jgi:hypothetical protein
MAETAFNEIQNLKKEGTCFIRGRLKNCAKLSLLAHLVRKMRKTSIFISLAEDTPEQLKSFFS